MTKQEQNEAARQFINRWKKRGYEKGDTQSFWIEFLQDVLGFDEVTQRLQFEKQVEIGERDTNYIDVYIPETKVIIEQKSLKIDLDKPQPHHNNKTPYEQAFEYNTHLTADQKANWIITSNFREIRIYDMNKSERERKPIIYTLDELQTKYSAFEFLFNKEVKRVSKEMEVSMQAGELVGKLYDELYKNYAEPNEETLKSLNILCVRLVFCMYAEDAGLFGKKDMFHDYLIGVEPKKIRRALKDLFRILDTPENERDADEDEDLLQFPYVNGGLFSKEDILIPQFTEELKYILLEKASKDFDWSKISPTIFGAIFESTLNPETRRSGGMHYTSIENIMKILSPLFLDELEKEFSDILKESNVGGKRKKLLKNFQNKLASLNFLDPAAGSGNFCTQSYICLRKLENKVLKELNKKEAEGQMTLNLSGVAEEMLSIKVSIQQFYGIEINDFAVTVAKTALWIAEAQMMQETLSFADINTDFLPLKSYTNIVEGNALRIDWNDVLSADKCTYLLGNPPFVGQHVRTKEQSEDMSFIWGNGEVETKLDYVICWYKKAIDYINNANHRIDAAFVSTNSICQGESVPTFWRKMIEQGANITFAYKSFVWDSEANDKAVVHCVIVGFTNYEVKTKYIYDNKNIMVCEHINPYLYNAPDVWITNRINKPQGDLPKMTTGSPPTDDGGLTMSCEEKEYLVGKYPILEKYIKPFIGAREFLHDKVNSYSRYCLWFKGCEPSIFANIPEIRERLQVVKNIRLKSNADRINKMANYPYLFCQIRQPSSSYLVFPRHSSQNRYYIPIGFMNENVIAGDACSIIPNVTIYEFGILTSNVHNAWAKVTCGRIKSDLRYSPSVYNNFPWPSPTPEQKKRIEETAQKILDARALYPNSSLADLYDPLTMPIELQKAHTQNDIAVMQAYGFNIKEMTEADCVAELMKMYQKLTEKV